MKILITTCGVGIGHASRDIALAQYLEDKLSSNRICKLFLRTQISKKIQIQNILPAANEL